MEETFLQKIEQRKIVRVQFPLNDIDDGHKFQQIVAEYFRCLKSERQGFHIADIHVEDNGVGGDDGCDIIVEFHFEDAIHRHSHRWIVECKSQKRAVSLEDLSTNNLETLLKAKSANGYLLVCKNDATAKLKRIFKECNSNGSTKYVIWNGTHFWHELIKHLSLIEAFFPIYYRENYLNNKAEATFEKLVKQFEEKLNKEKGR